MFFFFFKQKTAYEMRISDWSSDVCSSDLGGVASLDDLAAFLAIAEVGIEGVISGRALYDGRIDPAAALALLARVPSGEIGRASCRERSVSVRLDLGGRRLIKKKNINSRNKIQQNNYNNTIKHRKHI